jgi:hypothetical protein
LAYRVLFGGVQILVYAAQGPITVHSVIASREHEHMTKVRSVFATLQADLEKWEMTRPGRYQKKLAEVHFVARSVPLITDSVSVSRCGSGRLRIHRSAWIARESPRRPRNMIVLFLFELTSNLDCRPRRHEDSSWARDRACRGQDRTL